MTIYNEKLDKKPSANNPTDNLTEDDEIFDEEDMDRYLVKPFKSPRQPGKRRMGVLGWFIVILVLFVLMCVLVSVFWYRMANKKSVKPFVELCRMQYHEWKTTSNGDERSFKMEGEFYQQVEIDVNGWMYERLNVPPLLNARTATVLHDFDKKQTAIVDRDHGRCLIMPLNSTFAKSLPEFYRLVKDIKAGYDSPEAEVVRDTYHVLLPQIDNLSELGKYIDADCRFFETYHLVRDDRHRGPTKKLSCRFEGEEYCLGSTGTEFMGFVAISHCYQ